MKNAIRIALIGVLLCLGMYAPQAQAVTATATKPVIAPRLTGLPTWIDVVTTVTVTEPAVVVVSNKAYRHPEQVQATVNVQAGTTQVRVPADPYRLKHTWLVYVDGVVVAQADLNAR